jgi:hypothetical protein
LPIPSEKEPAATSHRYRCRNCGLEFEINVLPAAAPATTPVFNLKSRRQMKKK